MATLQNRTDFLEQEKIRESAEPDSYRFLLEEHHLSFTESENYYHVGTVDWVQGWFFDIAVIRIQIPALLRAIIPYLIEEGHPFRFAKDPETARALLNGNYGLIELGKVVTVYPHNEEGIAEIAEKLIELTKDFKGPVILTDRQLKNVVYTRYGGCQPVLQQNARGGVDEYIYDDEGHLVRDMATIPFTFPAYAFWPFGNIASPQQPKPETVLQDKYKGWQLLKDDIKGNVKKALWLEKFYRVRWCVIKEGRKCMNADAQGRDMGDRLRWQFELHKDLQDHLPIPKVYDLFEENEDTYLIMQYIKGVNLDMTLLEMYQGRLWWQLPVEQRLQLIDYAAQILNLIGIMHQKGYVHRDITPGNFLIGKRNQLWLIDLELSYSEFQQKPYPPFRMGTEGFMSPEQEQVRTPTVKQDIYAIGATLIAIFTGLFPKSFARENQAAIKDQLAFFIDKENLVDLIASCFKTDPQERPTLVQLKEALNEFRNIQIFKAPVTTWQPLELASKEAIARRLNSGIRGLLTQEQINENYIWTSKAYHRDNEYFYDFELKAIYPGYYEGLSGILFTLSEAKKAGLDIGPCNTAYQNSIEFLKTWHEENIPKAPGGFFGGTSGTALTLCSGIEAGLITNEATTQKQIHDSLINDNITGNGIVKGLAGKGLAILRASEYIGATRAEPHLTKIVEHFVKTQQKDGSWLAEAEDTKDLLVYTGIGHGMAGILSFLLGYLNKYDHALAKQATIRGLDWLLNQAKSQKGKQIYWHTHHKSKEVDSWLQNGILGIVLCFIKAYQILEDKRYKEIAEKVLCEIPTPTAFRDLTLANGLAGIGELFIEASKVFKEREWELRVDWMVQLLLHEYCQNRDGSSYWMVDATPNTNPGLMTGNCGIIHFLLRALNSDRHDHPYLNW